MWMNLWKLLEKLLKLLKTPKLQRNLWNSLTPRWYNRGDCFWEGTKIEWSQRRLRIIFSFSCSLKFCIYVYTFCYFRYGYVCDVLHPLYRYTFQIYIYMLCPTLPNIQNYHKKYDKIQKVWKIYKTYRKHSILYTIHNQIWAYKYI